MAELGIRIRQNKKNGKSLTYLRYWFTKEQVRGVLIDYCCSDKKKMK